MTKQYANQNVLCETDWVNNNLNNDKIKILEVDYDVENAYKEGHLPNSYMVWWKRDINDSSTRDIINKLQFEDLMSRLGVRPDDELILYGDFNNWFAAFAFWVFKYFGHKKIRIMNGGRKKWENENRPYTKDEPTPNPSDYVAAPPDEGVRAYLDDVKRSFRKAEVGLVDVRSVKEFSGEITSPQNIQWSMLREVDISQAPKIYRGFRLLTMMGHLNPQKIWRVYTPSKVLRLINT